MVGAFGDQRDMAKHLRIQFEGAIYHVTNRGIDRRELFWDEKDVAWFLECLEMGVERFHARIYLYCVMPNHFHLLVETPLGNLSQFMLSVQTRYGGYFNRRHRRSGYVYQGPYVAKLVEGDRYLLKLSRYLHLNPVETKEHEGKTMVEKAGVLRAYAWSSYREYIGKAGRKGWMVYGPVEDQARERMGGGKNAYRRFVEAGLAENDQELKKALDGSVLGIGGEGFIGEVKKRYQRLLEEKDPAGEESFRQMGTWLKAEDVLERVCREMRIQKEALLRRRGGAWMRGVAAEMLTKYAGMTQGQAARILGMTSGAAVSMRLKALAQRRREDRRLNAQIGRMETSMRKQVLAC